MITEGVSLGAIKSPPPVCPIILFVEQQTTGGYPKIATRNFRGPAQPGTTSPLATEIRFEQVSWDAARTLLLER